MPDTPLKILIDARMVTRHMHGIARYAINLVQGLADLGHEVSILSQASETPEILGKKYLTEVISCSVPFANPAEGLELSGKLMGCNFDIVHFPSFSVPVNVPKNCVITIHDMIHLRPPAQIKHKIYYRTVVKFALMQAAAVITVSEWSRGDLRQFLGVPSDKIHVIRNGLEQSWFQNSGETQSLPSGLNAPYFLCLSNPKPHKNVQTLLKACEQLWNNGKDFRLALSLGGAEIPGTWKFSALNSQKFHLIKNASRADIKSYIAGCKALVSPSLWEGFDLPAAEALVGGKPVLLSSGSAHQEFKGTRLRFYEPADDAEQLAIAMDKILTEREPEGSFEHNVPTRDQMIRETLGVYEKVLSGQS